jgi:SAM-dependent methyltransferase
VPLCKAPSVAHSPGSELIDRLRELGLTREFIRQMTERGDNLRSSLLATREAAFSDTAPAIALRLLFCGATVGGYEAQAALGDRLSTRLLDAGLLLETDAGVRSPFHLRLIRGLYLFSDYLGNERDAVMGAGETSGLLYEASYWDKPTESVLDLGCGAGTIALLWSSKAEWVVGTDVNERAVALAAWNASVNGIKNTEFRTGSLFDPVADKLFDVIVSQPPYYPAPEDRESKLTYLHGGLRGDELALQILSGARDHLRTGGRALIFTSWPQESIKTPPWQMRVFELTTNRKEIHGTRQSLNVLTRACAGEEAWITFEVPADDWGAVSPRRIDQLIASEALLRDEKSLLAATLRLPEGINEWREGDTVVLRFPPEALVGCIAVEDDVWREIILVNQSTNVQSAVNAGCELQSVRHALRRGWFAPISTG